MTENPNRSCSRCGTAISTDAAGGLCPRCLMAMNFDSRTMPEGEEAPHAPPMSPEELAEKFPQYEILECLGRGGMGVVYKARQKSLNRIVAIKILAPEREHEPHFAERFAREAELLAKLNHPHIVTIHDFGVADSQPSTTDSQPLYYLVMEYVDGVNLRDLLRDGKLEPKQALAIVPPICEALQYAHDKGIVHRDIKPENLLLDREGRIKIADFGIAGLVGAGGENIGTPHYMAPEQSGAQGGIDHRADIYALGVVLYEMLTGERPAKDLVAPSKKVSIDVRLDEVVLRALEAKPELRYQQVSILKTQVETIASQMMMDDFPAAQSSDAGKSQMVRIVEVVFGSTLTSPLAMRLVNISALGFLAFLAFLGNLPLPGMNRCFGFAGFSGFFGLIGFAFLVEFAHRRKAAGAMATVAANPLFPANCPVNMETWLTSIDRGDFAKAWETAAPDFQRSTTKDEWIGRMQKTRHPLGAVVSRKLVTSQCIAFGAKWEAKYDTSFENLRAAGETVTYGALPGGEWQPIGYLVQPAEANPARSKFFAGIAVITLLALTATGNAVAMMAGSALLLVVGLIWFAKNDRARTLLLALAAAGIATWTVFFIVRFTQHPAPVISPNSSTAILSASVDGKTVTLTGQSLAGSRLAFYAGLRDNGWSCGFNYPDRFTATLAQGRTGLQCVVQPALGKPVLTMDGTKNIGDVNLSDGKLVFKAGTPVQESDGAWSVTIGEFTTNSGKRIPVGAALIPPSREDLLPAQLTQQAWQLWQAGKLTEAMAKFNESLRLAPGSADTWSGLGWAQFNSGRSAEAEIAFQKAIGIAPNLPGGLNGLGQVYLSQRKYDQAEGFLLKAAEQGATAAMFGLARLYLLQGKFEQAEKWAQSVVDSGEADAVAKKMLEAAKAKNLPDGLRMKIEPPAPPTAEKTTPDERADRIAVEDLALQMIVAIREKNDVKLKSLASDRIKGWPDALPVFAVELREHFRQLTRNDTFDLRAGESLVDGDLAAVRCTGPAELEGKCLVLFFVKTADGWRNHSLRNSTGDTPLAKLLADLKVAIRKEK